MSNNPHIQTAVVASGTNVSGPFQVRNAKTIGVWAPALTSCQLHFLASFDTTSANYTRVGGLDGTHPFAWAVGAGSAALFTEVLMPFPYAKIECATATGSLQADNRSFQILSKLDH